MTKWPCSIAVEMLSHLNILTQGWWHQSGPVSGSATSQGSRRPGPWTGSAPASASACGGRGGHDLGRGRWGGRHREERLGSLLAVDWMTSMTQSAVISRLLIVKYSFCWEIFGCGIFILSCQCHEKKYQRWTWAQKEWKDWAELTTLYILFCRKP